MIKSKYTIFSLGNRKLPETTAIFSLPVLLTCPVTTSLCKRYCYAKIAEARYEKVRKHRKHNYLLSLQDNFISTIINEIKRLNPKAVRIHESGDFYNQEYFNKWVTIAKHFTIPFYTYTRVAGLNINKKPSNFIVRLSADKKSTNLLKHAKKFDGYAYVLENEESKGYYHCPGSCKKCSYCLHKGNVEFLKH